MQIMRMLQNSCFLCYNADGENLFPTVTGNPLWFAMFCGDLAWHAKIMASPSKPLTQGVHVPF